MAVRFDAVSEDYSRALSLGSQTALTAACWLKISTDRNTWSSAFFIDNGQTDNWGVQTAEDGVTVGAVMDGNSTAGFAATVGTWYFVCLATSGTTGTLYRKAAGASSLSTTAISGVTATSAATLRLGRSPWDDEWLNGCLTAVKVWNVQLTQAEIELESAQYLPNRLSSLVAFYPLLKPETTDYSGNARTLSGGTGVTQEDGPPAPWWVTSPRITLPPVAAGGTVTGAAAGAFGFTGTAAGIDRALGQATGSFGFTGAAAGIPKTSGTAVASFGFVGTAAGVDRTLGAGVASFGFAAVATGVPDIHGVAAAAFGFTGAAQGITGTPPVTGAGSGLFGFTATAQGQPRTLGAAATVFGFTATASGRPRVVAVAVASLGFTGTAAGKRSTFGTAQALLGFTAAINGTAIPPVVYGTAQAATGSAPTARAASGQAATTTAATMTVPTATGG